MAYEGSYNKRINFQSKGSAIYLNIQSMKM